MKFFMKVISIAIILFDLYFLVLSFKGALTLVRLCDISGKAHLVSIESYENKYRGIYEYKGVSFLGTLVVNNEDILEDIELHYQDSNKDNYYMGSTLSYMLKRTSLQFLFLIVFLVIIIGDRRSGLD